jgi:hypothetical protein
MAIDPLRAHAESGEITVGRGSDAVVVRARDHTWVAVRRDGRDVVTERSGGPQAVFLLPPAQYEVQTDGNLESVAAESLGGAEASPAERASLRLTSDAPNANPLDGVGDLPADGSATCTVTVEKVDAAGERLSGAGHGDEVLLRTTGGTLVNAKGKRVRSVKLRSGKASVRLVAGDRPGLVTVYAVAEGLAPAEVAIELV